VSGAVDRSGNFAYWRIFNSNDVSAYTINGGNGRLDRSQRFALSSGDKTFLGGGGPSGKFVYVANNNSNDVSAYHLNRATGP